MPRITQPPTVQALFFSPIRVNFAHLDHVEGVVPGTVFKIYSYLGRRIGRRLCCWPSLETIAQKLRLSISTVQRAIRKLVALGFLWVQSGHTGWANEYFLLWHESWGPRPARGKAKMTTHDFPTTGKSKNFQRARGTPPEPPAEAPADVARLQAEIAVNLEHPVNTADTLLPRILRIARSLGVGLDAAVAWVREIRRDKRPRRIGLYSVLVKDGHLARWLQGSAKHASRTPRSDRRGGGCHSSTPPEAPGAAGAPGAAEFLAQLHALAEAKSIRRSPLDGRRSSAWLNEEDLWRS